MVSVPVIGSLNGVSDGGWLVVRQADRTSRRRRAGVEYLRAGRRSDEPGEQVERRQLQVARAVKEAVSIPVAVKLSPFYSSIANFAGKLDGLGIDALVLFNRFYQPDIDVEHLEVVRVQLSSSSELSLRLRWLAILSGRIKASLAATGGVHTAIDAIKAVMAGAHGVQMVSALLEHGPGHLKTVREGIDRWIEEHEYESLKQMQGSMNLARCANPRAYESANYVKILQSWEID